MEEASLAFVSDLDRFARLVAALAPWLDQAVVVGGWAHRLYHLHPHAQQMDYPPLMTLDADIAVPAQLSTCKPDLHDRLTAAGFAEERLGRGRPPATHYHLRDDASGFYVEFLTPLFGRSHDRRNRPKTTVRTAGVSAQRLRHIDLLLHRPWAIELTEKDFKATIQVANPTGFLVQKLLIHSERRREDRSKDILYIHDTFQVFGSRLAELNHEWQTAVEPRLSRRSRDSLSQISRTLFGDMSDDIRRAALISPERSLSPETVRRACRLGLDALLA